MSISLTVPESPQLASRPMSPKVWSPCMWVMKIRRIWLALKSLRRNCCWVPSPQSKSQISERWGRRRATLETLRDRVGTPELVPKNVISTASFSEMLCGLGEVDR